MHRKYEVGQSLHQRPFKNFPLVVLAIILVFAVSKTVNACPNQETSSTKEAETVEKSKTKKVRAHSLQDPCISNQSTHDDYQWMQEFHATVSDSVFQSAVWFDNFFLDDSTEQTNPRTSARIRIGWEPKARDWAEIDTRFRVKVKLPHFKNKVDLILSDEDESTQNQLPLETVNTRPESDDDNFAAAVRFTHKKSKNRLLESRIGISGGDIFVKAKHKRRYTWNNTQSIKFEPSVYYFIDDGLGAKLLLEYDYQANDKNQYRINYSVRASESFSGLRWKHGFYRLTQLQEDSASITALQIQGERNGDSGFIVDKYTLSYRYRFNALKSWLFFEIEPFLEWPEEENYTTTPGIALRVEGFFHKG